MLSQGIEFGIEGQDVEALNRAGSVDGPGDGRRASSQLLPGRGEADEGTKLLAGVAGLGQQAVVNQALDERSQGAAVEGEGFGLAVELEVVVPELPQDEAQALADAAHQVCPYSNATRGNIPVTVSDD